MTKKTIGLKNRDGLTLDDLRVLVRQAERMPAGTPIKARTKMNGTLIEIEAAEPVDASIPAPFAGGDSPSWRDAARAGLSGDGGDSIHPRFSPPTAPPNT